MMSARRLLAMTQLVAALPHALAWQPTTVGRAMQARGVMGTTVLARLMSTNIVCSDAGQLTYFAGIRSRGEPSQLIAKYGDVDIDVELITSEVWAERKSEEIPYMPYITNPDGSIMLEVEVICKHLATLGGKFVVDAKQEELCRMANSAPLSQADPLFNLPDGAVPGLPSLEEWVATVAPVLKDLVVRLGDGPFFAGKMPGYAEAYLFHNLDNSFAIAKSELTAAIGAEDMDKLQAFYDRFAALDGIKEYLAERPKVWGVPGSRARPA